MCNIKITVAIDRPYSRYWGNNSAHATVTAEVTKRDGTHIAIDCTQGDASGCGYDKESAATCHAFNLNKVLQTLALWDGFNTNNNEYGPAPVHKKQYGYTYAFDACGMDTCEALMRANGFDVTEVRSETRDHCYTSTYVFEARNMPNSLAKLF